MQPHIVKLQITDELDLHTFSPKELGSLIPEYLLACQEAGIKCVRIIHGKGTGRLRDSVHAILKKLEFVSSYRLGGQFEGHWGATVVFLKNKNSGEKRDEN